MIAGFHNATELRRQAVQVKLDALRSAAQRNRLGQFATPNALAVEIAAYFATQLPPDHGDLHFADPSVGSGSFFSAAMAVFGGQRIASAVGVEIDPAFCDAARDLWADAGLQVLHDDFTRMVANSPRPPPPNLILTNPPYVRHHHIEPKEKHRLAALTRELTGVQVSGLAGLYVYFLLLATAWMEPRGFAAWLIPSEFMDVNYGAALKHYLAEKVSLIRIHRFDPEDGQFADALVSSAILVFQKKPTTSGHCVEFTFGGTLHHPLAVQSVPLSQLQDARKWSIYPCRAGNAPPNSTADGQPTLAEIFRINRGIATGGNEFFILDSADAQRRGLPDCHLRPILPSPRRLKTTLVNADENGYPHLIPQLCLIDCNLPESLLEARHPALWHYLQTAERLGIRNGYLVGKRTPWYKQELREPAPFLCTYMGRGSHGQSPFRFIWNHSRAICTNLYLMLYPRRALAAMLRRHPERAAEVFALLGHITGTELRGQGRVYGDGLHKIEPRELGQVCATAFVERWPELAHGLSKGDSLELFG